MRYGITSFELFDYHEEYTYLVIKDLSINVDIPLYFCVYLFCVLYMF